MKSKLEETMMIERRRRMKVKLKKRLLELPASEVEWPEDGDFGPGGWGERFIYASALCQGLGTLKTRDVQVMEGYGSSR